MSVVALLVTLVMAAVPGQGATTQTAMAGQSPQTLEAATRVADLASSARLDEKHERYLAQAEKREAELREQMTLMMTVIGDVLTALAVILVFLGAWGLVEMRKLRRLRREAEKLISDPDAHIRNVVRSAIDSTWSGLEGLFRQLPPFGGGRRLATDPKPMIAPAVALEYEDMDILILLGERLNAIGDAKKSARYLRALAKYWWTKEDWPRGASRSKRAIARNPVSARAHLEYANGLAYRASREPDPRLKIDLLTEAEREVRVAMGLARRTRPACFLHKLGWIHDERGEYIEAADLYRRAIQDRGLTPEQRADYRYDLACALTKAGRLGAAIDELRLVLAVGENWRLAQDDPDLKALRESSSTRAEFKRIIEEARSSSATQPLLSGE
jgi:tetratricopeptide (TPR) repeat protein